LEYSIQRRLCPRKMKRNYYGNTCLRQRRRLKRHPQAIQRTEFLRQHALDGFEGNRGWKRLKLLKVSSQLDGEVPVSSQGLAQLVQNRAAPSQYHSRSDTAAVAGR